MVDGARLESVLGVKAYEGSNPSLSGFLSRGVAQPGRALRSGRRSRRFESSHPDQVLR